jgi:hypothetical protein
MMEEVLKHFLRRSLVKELNMPLERCRLQDNRPNLPRYRPMSDDLFCLHPTPFPDRYAKPTSTEMILI